MPDEVTLSSSERLLDCYNKRNNRRMLWRAEAPLKSGAAHTQKAPSLPSSPLCFNMYPPTQDSYECFILSM